MGLAPDDVIPPRRRHWRRRAMNSVFATAATLGDFAAELRSARDGVEVLRDIPYGDHPVAHSLDLYIPRFAPRPMPVLLYIHGGAFTLCSKETHRGLAFAYARHAGYLVVNINYRLAPNHRFPAAIEDACAAYRWVVDNVARHGGDPSRIVVGGESAGGNLALGVAIAASYRRPEPYARQVFGRKVAPRAVMPLMPYLQASNPARHAFNSEASFLVMSVAQDIALAYLGERGLQASQATLMADPIRVLEECGAPERPFPEVFTGVGTADLCCLDVTRLEKACAQLAVPATTLYYENEIHAFHALRWRPAAQEFWREKFRFLRRLAG